MLAFCPVGSVLTRYGTSWLSRYARTKPISSRLELRLVVSNSTSRASSSVVVSKDGSVAGRIGAVYTGGHRQQAVSPTTVCSTQGLRAPQQGRLPPIP